MNDERLKSRDSTCSGLFVEITRIFRLPCNKNRLVNLACDDNYSTLIEHEEGYSLIRQLSLRYGLIANDNRWPKLFFAVSTAMLKIVVKSWFRIRRRNLSNKYLPLKIKYFRFYIIYSRNRKRATVFREKQFRVLKICFNLILNRQKHFIYIV